MDTADKRRASAILPAFGSLTQLRRTHFQKSEAKRHSSVSRIRTIKPEIARHEGLFELERDSHFPVRFVWAVLPTICDREGRFKWRPRALKADLLPYDDLDFSHILDLLLTHGFLVKYRHGTEWYGVIPTFLKHQHLNGKEPESLIPSLNGADESISYGVNTLTCQSHVDDVFPELGSWKGREGKGIGRERNSTEASSVPSAGGVPPVLVFPVVGPHGPEWTLSEAQVAEWATLYPGLDVTVECRKAKAWLHANPTRRKTSTGMARFLVGWLSRTTNRSGPRAVVPSRVAAPNAEATDRYLAELRSERQVK